jgi:gluconate 2-dehydrogenase gamma chain
VPRALRPREWQVVESMTARILPTDDTPGAVEAACVNFIDKALANEDAEALPAYRAALAELDRVCRASRGTGFVELTPESQDAVLSALEQSSSRENALETAGLTAWTAAGVAPDEFFRTVRMHTILGFVLDPRHGGNRDYVGWKTMGFPGPVHHLGGSRPEQMRGVEPFVPIWERGEPPTSDAQPSSHERD